MVGRCIPYKKWSLVWGDMLVFWGTPEMFGEASPTQITQALCTADISDMVAAVTNGPAAGVATTSDCADLPVPEDELLGLQFP